MILLVPKPTKLSNRKRGLVGPSPWAKKLTIATKKVRKQQLETILIVERLLLRK
jgi:hypothetical protein